MGKFILFLDRLINLCLCLMVIACLLSLVPNINPDYPLFHYIFTYTGFYLIPPVFGFLISPMLIMMTLVMTSIGLRKIYLKHYASKERKIVFMTKEEFMKKFTNNNEDKKDDK
ncbi:MAG: hypothetical protein NC191_06815 [Muribaculaceae bacterium]|nr:hypothetical protein [Muribaculaceae bacterium]